MKMDKIPGRNGNDLSGIASEDESFDIPPLDMQNRFDKQYLNNQAAQNNNRNDLGNGQM